MRIVTFVVLSLFLLSTYLENVECTVEDDSLDSQRKNEVIERKLKEAIEDILITYQKPKDLKLKSTFTLSIALPPGVEEDYITDVVIKTFENILSETFAPSRTGSPLSIVNFRLKTHENEKDKNGGARKQNILVTFSVPNIDSNGECVTSDSHKNDTWCSEPIKWSFEPNMTDKRMKHIQKVDKGFFFDFNDPLWAHLRSWMKSVRGHNDDTEIMKWNSEIANMNEKRRKREINHRGIITFDYYNPQYDDFKNSLESSRSHNDDTEIMKWNLGIANMNEKRRKREINNRGIITFDYNNPQFDDLKNSLESSRSLNDDTEISKWNLGIANMNEQRRKREINARGIITFDYNNAQFDDLKNSLEVQIASQVGEKACLTLDIKSRNHAWYDEWMLITMEMNSFISKIDCRRSIKYIANPALLECKTKTLRLYVRLHPPNEELQKQMEVLRFIFNIVFVPVMKHKNPQSKFKYISTFNAIDKMTQKVTENTANVVIELINAHRSLTLTCAEINDTIDRMNEYIHSGRNLKNVAACEKVIRINTDKEYYIVKFRLSSSEESEEDCPENFGNTTPETSTPETTVSGIETTTTETIPSIYKTTTEDWKISKTTTEDWRKTTTTRPFTTPTKPGNNTYKTTTPKPFTTPTEPVENTDTSKTTTPYPIITSTKPGTTYKTTTPKTQTTDVTKTPTPVVPDRNSTGNCTNKSYLFIRIITEEMFPILFEKFPDSELSFKKQEKTPKFCQTDQYWSIEMKFDNRRNSAPTEAATLKRTLDGIFRIFEHYCRIEYDLSEAIINRRRVKIFICFQYLPGQYCRSDTSTRDALITALLENPLQITEQSVLSKCFNTMKHNDATYDSPEGQLVQKIVLEKILPIFCAVYPSRETKTEITRRKDSSEGFCHPETFDIVLEIVGEIHFRYETVKYTELLLEKLQEIHTKITAACFLNGGVKTGSNVQTTIRIKVAKLNGSCAVPKDENARICSSDEEEQVSSRHLIPAGI